MRYQSVDSLKSSFIAVDAHYIDRESPGCPGFQAKYSDETIYILKDVQI